MKCYRLNDQGVIKEGLRIFSDGVRPYARILDKHGVFGPDHQAPRAVLDDKLAGRLAVYASDEAFSVKKSRRLLRCNIEKRAELWLTPETSDTRDQTLVLCTAARACKELFVTVTGEGSEFLFEMPVTYVNSWFRGNTALIRLSPGNVLKIEYRPKFFWERLKGRRLWFGAWQAQPDGTLKILNKSEFLDLKKAIQTDRGRMHNEVL